MAIQVNTNDWESDSLVLWHARFSKQKVGLFPLLKTGTVQQEVEEPSTG